MRCRFCAHLLTHTLCDLGITPLANRFLKKAELGLPEPKFPLKVFVCSSCFLVQVDQFETPDHIFSDYAYFSSYSESFLNHARAYVNEVSHRFSLNDQSQIVEVASNDGYLLQYFVEKGCSVLGVEPAQNVASVAEKRGISTQVAFFGKCLAEKLAKEGFSADLLIANNVLAHVPGLNDFVAGLKILLKSEGVLTLEFPHLLHLMQQVQFDTIYHEHFSYFSFGTVRKILEAHGLYIFDVQEIPTHGGSLRVYARHQAYRVGEGKNREPQSREAAKVVGEKNNDFFPSTMGQNLIQKEEQAGLFSLSTYQNYEIQIQQLKTDLLAFLHKIEQDKKKIAAYGTPAKGNTFLNYCGINTSLIPYTVDLSPHKQGLYLPGTQIPILAPEKIFHDKPDYILILPWNLTEEITSQMAPIRQWGGKFVCAIPEIKIF